MVKQVTLETPLGPDALVLRHLSGSEQLGRLYEYEVEALSKDAGINLGDVLGKTVTVKVDTPDGQIRHFGGLVAGFGLTGQDGEYAVYRAVLRPRLWRLTRKSDCRIFQAMSVPDIVKEVMAGHGVTDVRDELSGSYEVRPYVVQYRETDFDFVSRLLEQEGIYYFFEHEAAKQTVVLADSRDAHKKVSGYESVPFYPPHAGARRDRDHLYGWTVMQQTQPGACVLNDFDFERPKASLLAKRSTADEGAEADLEIYDYPGDYGQSAEGERYAETRLQQMRAEHEVFGGNGNARGLSVGCLFSLTGFPRDDQNDRDYLVVHAGYDVSQDAFTSGGGSGGDEGPVFQMSLSAIDAKVPYRPPRTTPKPVVQGPQTALVVGKSGEEIWTDEYGRIKVQFHWDRRGESDERSSCWVRVAQVWAGPQWGAMHIPRVGQEVVVDFLEGDPDRPLVTGRLYNADNMPPYELPGSQTQSGIKSRSSKEGGPDNSNEIRFEDKKGEEHFFAQAEKDMQVVVKNDAERTVGHDRKTEVKNDETVIVGGSRSEEVAKDERINIGENRSVQVGKDETIAIEGARTESVAKDATLSVDGAWTHSVAKDASMSVEGNATETVTKDASLSVEGKRSVRVTKDQEVSIDGKWQQNVQKEGLLDVGKKLCIKAGDELVIQVGDATISLKKNGEITLKGKDINAKGSGKVNVKASGDLILKGSKVAAN